MKICLYLILLGLLTLAYAQQGDTEILTIENGYITYLATSPYEIELLRFEKLIYRDGKLIDKEIVYCDLKDRNFLFEGYFEKGHTYRIELVNPVTREIIYVPLKFTL